MYESFFGFSSRPFLAAPQTSLYFPAAAIESARSKLTRCIERAEGCGLLIGATGMGKTLLCEVLAEHFSGQLTPLLLANLRLTTCKELLQALLYQLGAPHRRLQEGELRLSLIDHLHPEGAHPNGILLIADEAHTMPPRLFEELRLLTNMVRNGNPRIRLIMAGGPVLEERFAQPRMASFNQRISARCYLEPFTAKESSEYVRAQTAGAGADPDQLWNDTALRAIHRHATGCPRLINQLCDQALVLAASTSCRQLTETEIDAAWADLQQLPLPTGSGTVASSEDQNPETHTAVIEFGSLDGDSVAVAEMETDPVQIDGAVGESAAIEITDTPLDVSPSTELDIETESPVDRTMGAKTAAPIEAAEHAVFEQTELSADATEAPPHSEVPCCEKITIDQFVGVEANNIIQIAPEGRLDIGERAPEGIANFPNESFEATATGRMQPSEPLEATDVSGSLPEETVEKHILADALSLQSPAEKKPWPEIREHPMIPVRQRDYRDLLARLYDCNTPNSSQFLAESGYPQ